MTHSAERYTGETDETSSGGLVGTDLTLSTVLETLPVGALVEDDDREIVAVNPTLCELLGIDAEPSALVGRNCARVAENRRDLFVDPERFVSELESILDRREPVYDDDVHLADGRTLERTYVPCTLPDGDANLWLYRERTDRTERTERTEREDELERRTERLEEFVSVVSHDLRNPLNVAIANLEGVAEEYDDDRIDATVAALDRMASVIDDLFALAHEGAAIDDREPVTLDEVVREAWTYVETADATLEIDADGDRVVSADRGRLAQVFENLFRNAIEHGGRGVRITVGTMREGIYVADDGSGVPAEKRDRIFDDGYSTNEHGSGVGLRITETIVDAHGWEIEVGESRSGGARFEITGVRFLE